MTSLLGFSLFSPAVTPQMGDNEAAEIVKNAMESGCIKQRNTVAIVTGIMGAGKSTFLKRLFRQDIPSSYTSTGVTGDSYRGVMGHLASLRSLQYMPRGRILKLLAPLLKLGVPEGDVEAVAQIFMDAQAVSTPRPRSASSNPVVAVTTEPTYSQDTLKGLVKEESEESEPTAQTSTDSLELDLIHVLDTGGQPECMEVMPTLIHNSDLVILVLNLARGLECCTTPFCAEKDTRYEKSTLLQRQNKQIIRQLIRTMQAKRARSNWKGQGTSSCSRFLVIGTHKDCIKPESKLNDVLKEFNEKLEALFGQVVEHELSKYGRNRIFPLNLHSPKSEDEKVLSNIRKRLRLRDIKGFELPLSFFMFEQDAHKSAMGVAVLSFQNCMDIGARLKMSPKCVQAALLYLHKHNVFLYFQDILPDLVFLDPQVPLDLVNAMVRLSYKVKSDESVDFDLTDHMERCLTEGIFTEDLLKHEELSTCFVPNVYQPRDAIELLKKIYAIAPLRDDRGIQEYKEYVMMCLLPDKTEDEIRSLLPSSPRVSPVLVRFDKDCAPNGCFGNTISCLIMKYGWDLLLTHHKPKCLTHNIVQFSGTPTVPVQITLVSSTENFEVHVNPDDSQEDTYCTEICSNVFSAVKDVLEMMHYDIDIEPAFRCPCNSTEPHAATITPPLTSSSTIAPNTKLKCTITTERCDLKDEERVWIEKRTNTAESKHTITLFVIRALCTWRDGETVWGNVHCNRYILCIRTMQFGKYISTMYMYVAIVHMYIVSKRNITSLQVRKTAPLLTNS